jgi:ribosomal-protein-alanine N-acetyltransferase
LRTVSSDPVLETSRLVLRRFRLDDLDALAGVLGDAETMSFYPHPFSRTECRRWIEWNLGSYDVNGFGLWAMELKDGSGFAGDCGLTVQNVDGVDEVEVGWHVHRRLWGRGLATEAGGACRDYAFDTVGVPRLISLIRPVNLASKRVAEKIGLTVWKETERGGWPHLVFSMTAPEFAAFRRGP